MKHVITILGIAFWIFLILAMFAPALICAVVGTILTRFKD